MKLDYRNLRTRTTKKCEEYVNAECKEVAQLNKKVDDLENRSRRNNIVIFGLNETVDENNADLEQRVTKEILDGMLGVQVKSIERVHRIGKKHNEKQRPVILRFYDFTEKMTVLRNCSKLKGKKSSISISEDFSKPVRILRSKLWQFAKTNREKGDKVTLVFDKLKVNDDLFVWNSAENKRVLLTQA